MEYTDYMEDQKKLELWYGYEEHRMGYFKKENGKVDRVDISVIYNIDVKSPEIVSECCGAKEEPMYSERCSDCKEWSNFIDISND